MKIRFLEPGNRPYKPTPLNYFVYDRYIRTPSVGLNTLATIVKELVDDTYMYSESISRIDMADVEDADIVFIGIFTFAAVRGYELADHLRAHGRGLVVLGGGPRGAAGLPRLGLDGGGGAALHRLSAPAGALRDDCRP